MMTMSTSEVYCFKARAEGLPKKDVFGKSDPYLVFRVPAQVSGEKKTRQDEERSNNFKIGGTVATVVAGVTIAAAVALVSTVAIAVAPVAAGAAAFCAYKYAKQLHPEKPGYNEIFVSEVKKNTLFPTWDEFQLAFLGAFADSEILVEVWDWDRAKPSDFMGSCVIPMQTLLSATEEMGCYFKDKKGRTAGTFYISCNRSFVS